MHISHIDSLKVVLRINDRRDIWRVVDPCKGRAHSAIALARIGGYRSFSGDLGEQKL